MRTNFFQAAFFSRIIFNILEVKVGVREFTSLTVLKGVFLSISTENLEQIAAKHRQWYRRGKISKKCVNRFNYVHIGVIKVILKYVRVTNYVKI